MKMFKTIIVAYDGSIYSEKALKTALNIANVYNATVHLVSIIHIPDFVETKDELDGIVEDGNRYYKKLHEKAEKIAESFQVKIEKAVISGNPANSIISYSENLAADLIVIGEKGKSGIKRHVLGSVATNLSRYSNCSILIVRI